MAELHSSRARALSELVGIERLYLVGLESLGRYSAKFGNQMFVNGRPVVLERGRLYAVSCLVSQPMFEDLADCYFRRFDSRSTVDFHQPCGHAFLGLFARPERLAGLLAFSAYSPGNLDTNAIGDGAIFAIRLVMLPAILPPSRHSI